MRIDNKKITTVISDVDGTLLPADTQTLGSDFFPVIEKLLDSGITFIAASGRQYPNMKRLFAPIEDRIGIVSENGSLIAWKGQVLHTCTIPHTLAMELMKDMQTETEAEILISSPNTCYAIPKNFSFLDMLKFKMQNIVTVPVSYESIQDDILKIALKFQNNIPVEVQERFHQKYDSVLTVVDAGNGWFDFIPKESGKGRAITFLANRIGFSLEESVSFGDSENDISMLKTTGISFAMEHAKPSVKAVADNFCDRVEAVLASVCNI